MKVDLNAKDERIADLYASGYTVAQIAAEMGGSVTTIYKKLKNPLIRARIAEQRAAVLRPIRDLVVEHLRRNVAVLAAIRDNVDEPSRNRIAACSEIRAHFTAVEPLSEEAPLRAQLEAAIAQAEQSNED